VKIYKTKFNGGLLTFCIILLSFVLCSNAYSQTHVSDSLRKLIPSLKDTAQVNALNLLAKEIYRSNLVEAMAFATRAKKISEKLNYSKGIATAHDRLGRIFSEKGELDTAKKEFEVAIQLFSALNELVEVANVYIGLANLHDTKGEYKLALDHYLKAIDLYSKKNNKKGLGLGHMGVGNILYTMGQYDKAANHYKLSYDILEEIKSPYSSWSLNNLASVYSMLGKLDEALNYYQISLDHKLKENDFFGASFSYGEIGSIFFKKKKLDKALEFYNKALQLKEKYSADNLEAQSSTQMSIGEVYFEKKDFNKALKHFQTAFEQSKRSSSAEKQTLAYKKLAKTYAELGDYKAGYLFEKAYAQLNDSLLKEISHKNIAEMEEQFQAKQKEDEIKLLNQQNEIKEVRIQQSESETQRKTLQLLASLGGLFLAGGFLVVVIRRNRERKKTNELLQHKNGEIIFQRDEIEKQKDIIEEKHKEIKDSINYAKRIQSAILTSDEHWQQCFTQHFIFFKPKDVVSGDFYWLGVLDEEKNKKVIWAVADCTGHGVPGAFMSMIGNAFLNEIIIENKTSEPEVILNILRDKIIKTLDQKNSENFKDSGLNMKDGMDISLCVLDTEKNELTFAGANNPIWIVRNNKSNSPELIELKADKMPIGSFTEELRSFKSESFSLVKGDIIYAFSDGFPDQFGGPKGKKFKYKQLEQKLLSIFNLPLHQQKEELKQTFEDWKIDYEQTDDVCVIGVQI